MIENIKNNANRIATSILMAMPLSFPFLSYPNHKDYCTEGRLVVTTRYYRGKV